MRIRPLIIAVEEQRKAALRVLPACTNRLMFKKKGRSETVTILTMSNIFAESADSLPKEARAKLTKVFKLLTSNPRHPSLQLKKIKGAIRPNVYECRLDRSWRLILQGMDGMDFDLLYVGAHDKAIRYGARLREPASYYGESMPIAERLESYLAGNDKALEFVTVTPDDLERFGE